jgi:hypothetical protein
MDRYVIQSNPEKIGVPREFHSEKDRFDPVICFLCFGITEIKVEAEGSKMFWIFDRREIKKVEDLLLSGKPFEVPWQNVIPAYNRWKDALIRMKEMRRNG